MFARLIILITGTLCVNTARAQEDIPRGVFGSRPGYLFNVEEEKNLRVIEMVMLEKPKDDKKPLIKVIFNDKLSKEFQDQYKYRFGLTQAEQIVNNPGRDGEYTYYNSQNVTFKQYQSYQKQFGEYMARRLIEYHFDHWAKNDPAVRPVYQMKDRISNLDVKVRKGYNVKLKYNFAGPAFEVSVENPYDIEFNVVMLMNGIISSPKDIIYSLAYQLTTRVRLEALYKQTEQIKQLGATRRMTKRISASITGSSGQLPGNPSIHQDLILLGMGWSD